MNTLTRIVLIAAIAVVALIGIGFGMCGVAGLALGLRSSNEGGTVLLVLGCGLGGIAIAVGAALLIHKVLWKALRRKDEE